MDVLPLNHNILVKRSDPISQTEGGIIVPPTAQGKALSGTVVAAYEPIVVFGSANEKMRYCPVEAGDTVLFAEESGTEVRIDGEDYLILEEYELLAKVK